MTITVVTVGSQTATLDGANYTVSYAPDGNPRVHVLSGTVSVTAYTPALTGSVSARTWLHGAAKNLLGTAEACPFDYRANGDTAGMNAAVATLAQVPIVCSPGDAVLIGKSDTLLTGGVLRLASVVRPGGRAAYYDAPGRSILDYGMVIVFVNYPDPGVECFRVMGLGGGFQSRVLRNYSLPVTQMNLALLPSTIDLATLGVTASTEAYLEDIFGNFCGEWRSGWVTDQVTPDYQHPGYGSYMSGLVSQALVVLCSTLSTGAKTQLATNLVQWGLDLAGAYLDGRSNYLGGGHMQGRKALIILAGHLLGIPALANPDGVAGTSFQESQAYFTATPAWWFGGWNYGFHTFNVGDGDFLARHPSTWTYDPPSGYPRGERFRLSYLSDDIGSQVGTALAMHLMGRTTEMNASMFGMVNQWMQGPGASVIAVLAAAGIGTTGPGTHLPWQSDYVVGTGAGMCAAAWNQLLSPAE